MFDTMQHMPADRSEKTARTGAAPARARGRQRASHSLDTVLAEAIAILDESGEPALTFRALAARLGGGVASIYWYVASRDELLDLATEEVMGRVLEDGEPDVGVDVGGAVGGVAGARQQRLVERGVTVGAQRLEAGLERHDGGLGDPGAGERGGHGVSFGLVSLKTGVQNIRVERVRWIRVAEGL